MTQSLISSSLSVTYYQLHASSIREKNTLLGHHHSGPLILEGWSFWFYQMILLTHEHILNKLNWPCLIEILVCAVLLGGGRFIFASGRGDFCKRDWWNWLIDDQLLYTDPLIAMMFYFWSVVRAQTGGECIDFQYNQYNCVESSPALLHLNARQREKSIVLLHGRAENLFGTLIFRQTQKTYFRPDSHRP